MYDDVCQRTIKYALYIVENKATIRATALRFGVSKSSVHNDLKLRLKQCDEGLYYEVKQILENNFNEKHSRGGLATKQKYLHAKQVEKFDEMDYYYGC